MIVFEILSQRLLLLRIISVLASISAPSIGIVAVVWLKLFIIQVVLSFVPLSSAAVTNYEYQLE